MQVLEVKNHERFPEIAGRQLPDLYYNCRRHRCVDSFSRLGDNGFCQEGKKVTPSQNVESSQSTEQGVEEHKNRKFRFSTLGIILGIFFVILALIWVMSRDVASHDSPDGNEQSGEEATWVG